MNGCVQSVAVNSPVSTQTPGMSSVHQEFTMGWELFNIAINDVESKIEHAFNNFADDSKHS